ncbi:hypothetical protein MIMGU_mgv1a007199mg [Erythranthe guttata]|uniref:Glycosyltransferase n=1 Tax=Erythranthe guttata TaxID=4155 RepID=A0A022S0Y3_ERYGU|nr:hypothetical protein MIMGU_mgv1a007199mg [Erythranthe guttata]
MDAKEASFRVLMFPWLAHGHIFPFLELAKKLSKSNFHIYFCSTPVNLDSVTKHLSNDVVSNIELVELHLPSLPQLPPQYHTTKNTPPHLMPTLMHAFQMSSSSFSDIIGDLKPDLLIYDGFQPWSAKSASSIGIPSVNFATSSCTTISFFHHLHTHKTYGDFPFPSIFLRDFEKRNLISRGESIEVQDKEEGFAFGIFELSCDIVLVKSCCREIEGKYMDYFSTLCNKKIVPVGPLQMEEIAKGLLLVGEAINFIWVVRSPGETAAEEGGGCLPEGFSAAVEGRGLVLKGWAPQAAILAHPSVGGFMSHCGWSSVTESMYFGVPVVAVPLKLDQPVNCRMAVEGGVAVEVGRDEVSGEFSGEGVAEAVSEVMIVSGERLRYRAREMSEKMKMEEREASFQVADELARICAKKVSP